LRKRLLKSLASGLMVLLFGCARYHPLPLEEGAGKAPELKALVVEASRIHHPLLPSLKIDLADGLSPDEAALLAVVANPDLRVARDEKKIASIQLLQAGLLPNPWLHFRYESPTGGRTSEATSAYELELEEEISAFLGRTARLASARAEKAAVDLSLAWKEWQVAEAAKLHALRLLWAERKVALLRRMVRERENHLHGVQRAVSLGEKTALDLAAARAAWEEARLRLEIAREERARERMTLNRILGLSLETPLRIQKGGRLLSWPPIVGKRKLLAGLSRRRLDLLALKMSYKAQDERLRAAVSSQFPRIALGLLRARDVEDVITTGATLSIEFPFFNRARVQVALEEASREKLYHEYQARLFSARAQVMELETRIAFLRRRIILNRHTVAALQRTVATYRQALHQGNGDLLTYYQLEDELLERQLRLLELEKTQNELGVALEIASGIYFPLEVRHAP